MRINILFVILSLGLSASGQSPISNESVTDTSKHIFFLWVDNHIRLNPDTYSFLTVKGAGSKLVKLDNENYIINVRRIGICTVTIYKNGNRIFSENYQTDTTQYPIATLDGRSDTISSVNRILVNPGLLVSMPKCFFKHNMSVTSYYAIFIHGEDSISTYASGSRFTPEQEQQSRKLITGDKIFFERINARSPDSRTQRLPSFWIKIQ
jgi:GldM C-terminal domain